jgi:hypothetical protein
LSFRFLYIFEMRLKVIKVVVFDDSEVFAIYKRLSVAEMGQERGASWSASGADIKQGCYYFVSVSMREIAAIEHGQTSFTRDNRSSEALRR